MRRRRRWRSPRRSIWRRHRKKKTVLPGLTRAAAHSVSPTFAQSNLSMVAPPGRADRIASEEQSALVLAFELDVRSRLGVSRESDEEAPQAEKARTSARTGTIVRLRRTRLLRAL